MVDRQGIDVSRHQLGSDVSNDGGGAALWGCGGARVWVAMPSWYVMLVTHDMMWVEPVGGVSPAHGDAPRMDAKDSVGFT